MPSCKQENNSYSKFVVVGCCVVTALPTMLYLPRIQKMQPVFFVANLHVRIKLDFHLIKELEYCLKYIEYAIRIGKMNISGKLRVLDVISLLSKNLSPRHS